MPRPGHHTGPRPGLSLCFKTSLPCHAGIAPMPLRATLSASRRSCSPPCAPAPALSSTVLERVSPPRVKPPRRHSLLLARFTAEGLCLVALAVHAVGLLTPGVKFQRLGDEEKKARATLAKCSIKGPNQNHRQFCGFQLGLGYGALQRWPPDPYCCMCTIHNVVREEAPSSLLFLCRYGYI